MLAIKWQLYFLNNYTINILLLMYFNNEAIMRNLSFINLKRIENTNEYQNLNPLNANSYKKC